jgi:hypothetical protein
LIRRDVKAVDIPFRVEGLHGPTVADFYSLRYAALSEVVKIDLATAREFAAHSSVGVTE